MKNGYRSPTNGAHLVVLLGAITLIGGCSLGVDRLTHDEITAKVRKTEIAVVGHGKKMKSQKRIYTDKETFRVDDSWAYATWSSADTYGAIEQGKTYKFGVYGFRIPFFSAFRNVIAAQEVTAPAPSLER